MSPFVLLGGTDAHDLVVVEILIADYPNTIFVVLNYISDMDIQLSKSLNHCLFVLMTTMFSYVTIFSIIRHKNRRYPNAEHGY